MRVTYLVIAPDAADLAAVAPALRALKNGGDIVHLVRRSGTFGPELSALKSRYRLAPQPHQNPRWRQRVRGAVRRPRLDELGELARAHPGLPVLAERSNVLIAIGGEHIRDARSVILQANPSLRVMSVEELDETYRTISLGQSLAKVSDDPRRDLTARLKGEILRAARRVTRLSEDHTTGLIAVVAGLHRKGDYAEAWEIAGIVATKSPRMPPSTSAEFAALATQVELSARAQTGADVAMVVTNVLRAADEALVDGHVDAAAHRLTLALSVLFHRELHADVDSSPLVDDPDTFLAPLRGSDIYAELRRSVPMHDREVDRRTARDRVLVLPGSYGRFSRAVVDALDDSVDITVLDMGSRSHFMGMGVHEPTLRARLGQALGEEVTPDYELLEAMEAVDVVFADWADRGAVWTTMQLPRGVRMVLRIHSMDALSPWIHVLDWSRVSDVVFVSPHLRDIVVAQIGDDLHGTRIHVVSNIVNTDRFGGIDRPAGLPSTLALVGWAQKVKDPLWALEVLAQLRADDPRWRLKLIGNDFRAGSVRSSQDYADAFWRRLTDDDVVGGVDFVDFTDDLPGVMGSVDYILSSSLRESFGVGLVEAAAAGAVPVVRIWPMFRRHGGPRSLFPQEWIVADVAAAVERVRATSGAEDWSAASARAKGFVATSFGSHDVAQQYRDVILGHRR